MKKNQELAKIFSSIALYIEMEEGVSFRSRAYEKAAGVIESLEKDVSAFSLKDKIPGIGDSLGKKIEEYLATGKIDTYERLKKKIPVNIEELTSVEGLGPKMVQELYKELNIKNLKELEKAAKTGKIEKLENFGEKTQQNILQGIEFTKTSKGRWLLGDIYPYVEELVNELQSSRLVAKAIVTGSIRRGKETIGDVDILVTTANPEKVMKLFLSLVKHEKVWGRGLTKTSVRTTQGFDVDVRVLPDDVFGAGLQYFTGSKEHNVKLRTHAIEKGFKLSEYGLFKGKKRIACKTEADVYKALGMAYIEPELREDKGEIEAALKDKLPKVIPYDALQGDLQIQTDWTDGKHSIETMAKEAKRFGLKYIAITDHTQSLAMTRGSDEKKLLRQMIEIDKVQKKVPGIKILKGAEVDIKKDGILDIEDNVLAKLDMVGVSVHSNFKMPKEAMTKRIVRAMRNPHVDMLFHPTGRLIHKREAYEVDVDRIIEEAKNSNIILEANASPSRLDLKDTDIKKTVEAGVRLAINSDAHHKDHYEFLRYGIAQARRGWAEAKDIVNTQQTWQKKNQ
ncbi:DNA polymerase/3'-5' exonuclease PolX [Patescibacteria group bacterium]|nr:DNA polymerase/3'-5' exonuclease PolX [Patescibacteria group bacterium]